MDKDRGTNFESGEHARLLEIDVSIGNAAFAASGDGELVMVAFTDFQALLRELPDVFQPMSAPAVPTLRTATVEPEPVSPGPDGRQSAAPDDEPLPVFLRKRPGLKTNAPLAAGIVVWGKRHQGKDELTFEEIEKLWRESGRRVPANIPRDLGSAVKEGWIHKPGSGSYAPTSYGETFVDEQVNDG